jgi:outer membrane autotransporter protein
MKKSVRNFSGLRALGVACLSAGALLAAAGAQAQSQAKGNEAPFYGEIGYTALTYKEPGFKAHPKALRLLGGYELNPNLSVEGHVLLGTKDGSVNFEGETVKVKADSIWGVFLKPKVAVMPDLELFGRLGFARTQREVSSPGLSEKQSANSFAYGLGAAYAITDKLSLSLDYMSYYDRKDIQFKGPTLGLAIKF